MVWIRYSRAARISAVYGNESSVVPVQASISPCFKRMSFEHQLEVDYMIDNIDIIEDGDEQTVISPDQYAEMKKFITNYTSFLQEATTSLELAVWKVKCSELFIKHHGNTHYQIRSDSRTSRIHSSLSWDRLILFVYQWPYQCWKQQLTILLISS